MCGEMEKEQVINELQILANAMREEFYAVPICLTEAVRMLKEESILEKIIKEIDYELNNPADDYYEIEKGLNLAKSIIETKMNGAETDGEIH